VKSFKELLKISLKILKYSPRSYEVFLRGTSPYRHEHSNLMILETVCSPGADLGGGYRGCDPIPPPLDDLRLSNTTGILQKKAMWLISIP